MKHLLVALLILLVAIRPALATGAPTFEYSTYLGGTYYDEGSAIAVDGSGNCYVAGVTTSLDFPTHSPKRTRNPGSQDVFVAKINAKGQFVFSTVFGGMADDRAEGIAVDAAGDITVVGQTRSHDFPVKDAIQPTFGGGNDDAFVVRLDKSGEIVSSTYIGGSGDDDATSVAFDADGHALVAGRTSSANFPTASPLQPALRGKSNAFVAKLDKSGRSLVYSSYLGGSQRDEAHSIAVGGDASIVVCGHTTSADFPLLNPLQPNLGGSGDGFITKMKADGTALVYSTYLGGRADDDARSLALDAQGDVFVTGSTNSPDFPAVHPIAPPAPVEEYKGNIIVAKIDRSGRSLIYSTTLGGPDNDAGFGIAVDAAGDATITGDTQSAGFPITEPLPPQLPKFAGSSSAFVIRLDTTGARLIYATFLGDREGDYGTAVAVDKQGAAYVTGRASYRLFPLRRPLQSINAGREDAFAAKLSESAGDDPAHGPQSAADKIAPLVKIAAPVANIPLQGLEAVVGTARAIGAKGAGPAPGLDRVELMLYRPADGLYWSGFAWQPQEATLTTDLSGDRWSRTTGWPSGDDLPPGTYYLHAWAYDNGGNLGKTMSKLTITAR